MILLSNCLNRMSHWTKPCIMFKYPLFQSIHFFTNLFKLSHSLLFILHPLSHTGVSLPHFDLLPFLISSLKSSSLSPNLSFHSLSLNTVISLAIFCSISSKVQSGFWLWIVFTTWRRFWSSSSRCWSYWLVSLPDNPENYWIRRKMNDLQYVLNDD